MRADTVRPIHRIFMQSRLINIRRGNRLLAYPGAGTAPDLIPGNCPLSSSDTGTARPALLHAVVLLQQGLIIKGRKGCIHIWNDPEIRNTEGERA